MTVAGCGFYAAVRSVCDEMRRSKHHVFTAVPNQWTQALCCVVLQVLGPETAMLKVGYNLTETSMSIINLCTALHMELARYQKSIWYERLVSTGYFVSSNPRYSNYLKPSKTNPAYPATLPFCWNAYASTTSSLCCLLSWTGLAWRFGSHQKAEISAIDWADPTLSSRNPMIFSKGKDITSQWPEQSHFPCLLQVNLSESNLVSKTQPTSFSWKKTRSTLSRQSSTPGAASHLHNPESWLSFGMVQKRVYMNMYCIPIFMWNNNINKINNDIEMQYLGEFLQMFFSAMAAASGELNQPTNWLPRWNPHAALVAAPENGGIMVGLLGYHG